MKNIDKNSQNKGKQSDDTLIYILFLLFLVALLVGGGIWVWHEWRKEPEINYDYETALGAREVSPTAKDVSKLLSDNYSLEKTIRRNLASENRRKPIPTSLKKEVEKELDNNISRTNEIVSGFKLELLDPEHLSFIYSQLYEQGKVLVRLRWKTNDHIPWEEIKKQKEVTQPNWQIPYSEEQEINVEMNKWINEWYQRAMKGVLKPEQGEVKLTELIIPKWINGEEIIGTPTPAQVAYFRKLHEWTNQKTNKYYRIDLSKPLELAFKGYTGFLTPEQLKGSTEGTMTFGLTTTSPNSTFSSGEKGKKVPHGYDECTLASDNYRSIEIGLKRELFFNRLGYDEWLVKIDQKKGRTYYDISFGQVVETISHELAHAVINSIKGEYDGERQGGHGELHDDFTKRIEDMMRTASDFSEFETWWWKSKKNGGNN